MPLDSEMQAILDLLAGAAQVDLATTPPLEAARQLRQGVRASAAPPAERAGLTVEDDVVPGPHGDVPIRIYRPTDAQASGVMVNLHGGGWVMGSVAGDDNRCRLLQSATGATIVSVDYRLAPENPFPAPLNDCRAALNWAWRHREELAGAHARLMVGGSSSGANLAAAVAIAARDEGIPLALQLLICPPCGVDFETSSYRDNAEGYFLTREQMRWFWDQYAPGAARLSPLAAVLGHHDLSGVAPAYVIVAEYDPLRDDGLAYAHKLKEAGVPVELHLYPGALHSFTTLAPASAMARGAFERIGAAASAALQVVSAV
jgi:acetyl esterase